MTILPERPLSMVIAALGGEGGGVLSGWVVRAAQMCGYPTQSTSIPGVAQRTGATTYYIEIYPAKHEDLDGKRPVMALYPAPGNMDLVVTSELMEAGRMLENGMVTPERTTLISSTHRVYSILERSAMGDELFQSDRLLNAAEKLARRAVMFDMARLAEDRGTVLNAVLLGIVAGSGELPIPVERFEASIREAGVAVEANLRGFEAGLAYMRGELRLPEASEAPRSGSGDPSAENLLAEAAGTFPGDVQSVVSEGVKRLVDYQGPRYARLYLDRLAPMLAADRERDGGERNWALTRETARHLALMMSYEDIIRVADLKSRERRMDRVRADVMAGENEPVRVTEFLKPGFEEMTSIMPPWMGRPIMNWARANRWARRFHFAMRVRTDTIFGFGRLWTLSKLRGYRPRTYRYAEEQRVIERWLGVVRAAADRHYGLAVEIAELSNLRKGYSDTHRRGVANFERVMDELAEPAARGEKEPAWAAEALAAARTAALSDPEGAALDRTMADLSRPPAMVAE